MSADAIATDLRKYAVKRWPTANHKFRKARLADLLGFSERRVRSFWEAKAASPRDDEVDAINALIGQGEGEDAALSTRIAELEARVARLMAVLDREAMEAAGLAAFAEGRAASDQRGNTRGRRSTD